MSVSVSMPQLGESVTEGTVTRWLKHEGDHVSADEPLLEVSTDKVDTEIPSPVSGILRGITVAEDETVAVGAELAVIDEDGSAASDAPSSTTAERAAPADQPASAGEPGPAGQSAHQGPGYVQRLQLASYQPPVYAEPAAYQPPVYAEPPAPQPRTYAEPPAYAAPAAYPQPPASQPPSAYRSEERRVG